MTAVMFFENQGVFKQMEFKCVYKYNLTTPYKAINILSKQIFITAILTRPHAVWENIILFIVQLGQFVYVFILWVIQEAYGKQK